MPKGVYDHKSHSRTTKAEIKALVTFCFREDIANRLKKAPKPHILTVSLYEEETGIKISKQLAYNQRGKWMVVNGELIETRERIPKSNTHRITKAELEEFVRFCFRDDIAELIGNDVHSYTQAAELYSQHIGKPFSPITARNQRGKWLLERPRPFRQIDSFGCASYFA